MLITQEKPVGMDAGIDKVQRFLHDRLLELWKLQPDQYKCYPRCYRNKTATGYVAENYEGGKDYKEVYWDDSLAAISFFGLSDRIDLQVTNSTGIHLVFFVNLEQVRPGGRNDEQVRKDVQNLIGNSLFGMRLTSVDLWLENVLREYPGSRRDDKLKAVDMHPTHCFRLNFQYQYNINQC